MEKHYDASMDIWGLGCILAELISCTYKERGPHHQLFPGTSCFPLSPCEESKKNENQSLNIISRNDQLKKILEVLGK
jgi:mitogen-activated protein kinase 1/3